MKLKFAAFLSLAVVLGSTAHAGCTGQPEGLDFDTSGNLWVAWYDWNEVEVLSSVEGTLAWLTGQIIGLNGPTRIAMNGTTLYVANSAGNNVTIYDNVNAETFEPPPAAAIGGLNRPLGVAVGPVGIVFVANNATSDVAAFGSSTQPLGIGIRSGDSSGFQFDAPGALTIANGTLYLGTSDGTVHSYTASNFTLSFLIEFSVHGIVLPQPPTEVATFDDAASGGPTGVAVDAQGNVWVSYYYSSDVVKYSANGAKLMTITSGVAQPEGIAIQPATGNVYVSNTGTCEITVYNSAGNYLGPLFIERFE